VPALSEIRTNEGHRPARWTGPLSAAAIGICLFGNLGAMGLVGPDEPRYAWIARAMAETSDWVTPRLYGQPWFEKPVLYYWAAALGFLLHLSAEWAARLPSACGALAAALTIAWLAKKHYGGDASSLASPVLLTPLLFSTSVAAIGFARAATPDMLFSATIALAMASAAMVFRRSGALRAAAPASSSINRDAWPLVLFGAFLGLAVLAKGPAAIILAAGAIGFWALATKHWRDAIRLAHPFAIAAFCFVALPWYVLCAVRNPEFLKVFLWQHNFERYLSPIFEHRQPFWYFGPIVLLALLPWTALLWPAAQEGVRLWREHSWKNSPGFFFACWAVFPVLFFSLSQSKLPGYILPATPALALLCAIGAIRALNWSAAVSATLLLVLFAAWIVLVGAGLHGVHSLIAEHFWLVDTSGHLTVLRSFPLASLAFVAAIVIAVVFYKRPGIAVPILAFCLAVNVEFVSLGELPVLDAFYSARPHAAFMHNDQRPDRIFAYRLSRSWGWGLAFYFRRELPEWSPDDPMPALVLTTQDGLERIRKLGRFTGDLEQMQPGLVYVPIGPVAGAR
jgi:4-amino-4-deoxy-L-arabinose transferase-like glycosyltransferase